MGDGAAGEPRPPGGATTLGELAARIESARFTTAFRGFEPREVREFLDALASDLRELSKPRDPRDDERQPMGPPPSHDARRVLAEAQREAAAVRREAQAVLDEARARLLGAIREADALRRRAQEGEG